MTQPIEHVVHLDSFTLAAILADAEDGDIQLELEGLDGESITLIIDRDREDQ